MYYETRNEACGATEKRIEDLRKYRNDHEWCAGDYDRNLEIYQTTQTDMLIDLLTDIARSLSYIANRLS